MIYKFKFSIHDDDNTLIHEIGEESGNLMQVWIAFHNKIMSYMQTKQFWRVMREW